MSLFSSNGKNGQSQSAPACSNSPGLSIIAADMRVEGQLHSTGMVRIEGTVMGNLQVDGQVIVADGGLVEGDIDANESVIAGEVRGSIVSSERIELRATAMVRGNLSAPKLAVQEGGVVEGRLRVGKQPPVPQQKDQPERVKVRAIRPARQLQTAVAVG
jgi:cytoskeletal protein CcmA (bactofilin family)